MGFFTPSPKSKIPELSAKLKGIETTLAQRRTACPEIWNHDTLMVQARERILKAGPTAENTAALVRLISQRSASLEVLQYLAIIEDEQRNALRLELRPLAHSATDEIEATLKTRLAEVTQADARASAELGKPVTSDEVLAELRKRLQYLAEARGHLDRGEMSQAFGRIAQAADVVL